MQKKPLAIIFITVFIDLIGFGIIIPLSPFLARHFGADAFQVGLLMAIYSLLQFLFAPFWGQLSDHLGRRPIILISLLGASLAHLWFAFATDLNQLFMARALAGLFGANISTAMAYIADITAEKDRSKGMGLIGAAFGLGFILGPFFGGMIGHLGESLGQQPPLGPSLSAVVAAIICFLNFVAAFHFLTESLPLGLRKGGTWLERLRGRPARIKRIMQAIRQPVVGQLMIMFFLASIGMAHMEASLFLYVQDKFSLNMTQASLGFAYVGLVLVFTQGYLIRKLLPKLGEKKLLVFGLSLAALGLAGIGLAPSVGFLGVAVTFLGLGNGLTNPSLTGSISLLTAQDKQGGTLGVNQSLSALGRILGPASGGIVYRDWSWSSPFWIASSLTFVALIMGLRLYKHLPSKASVGH